MTGCAPGANLRIHRECKFPSQIGSDIGREVVFVLERLTYVIGEQPLLKLVEKLCFLALVYEFLLPGNIFINDIDEAL